MYPMVPRINPASVLSASLAGECRARPEWIRLHARKAEVQQLDVAVGPHHDIVRFDVAMDDLRRVGDGKRFSDLAGDSDDPRERKPLGGELPQRGTVDEFHRDVAIGADHAGFIDRYDVRMVERGRERRLAQEAVQRGLIADHQSTDDLEGDLPTEARVERAIHLTHAAGAQQRADLINAERRPFGQTRPRLPCGQVGSHMSSDRFACGPGQRSTEQCRRYYTNHRATRVEILVQRGISTECVGGKVERP
jgi:hypothetical protein